MDQYISIIVFSIPGLLVYFWIQSLGLTPTVKHSSTELVAITALFWIPTILLTIFTYNLLYIIFDLIFRTINIDLSPMDLKIIGNLNDLQEMALNFWFISYFLGLSFLYSYFVAVNWIRIFDKYVLDFINRQRVKRKLTKLSDTTSVWDAFFHKFNEAKEESLVVEVYKIDNPSKNLIGSVIKMSRPFEMERSLVLQDTEEWRESDDFYKFKRKRAYVDIKSGISVVEINKEEPTRNNPISLGDSKVSEH